MSGLVDDQLKQLVDIQGRLAILAPPTPATARCRRIAAPSAPHPSSHGYAPARRRGRRGAPHGARTRGAPGVHAVPHHHTGRPAAHAPRGRQAHRHGSSSCRRYDPRRVAPSLHAAPCGRGGAGVQHTGPCASATCDNAGAHRARCPARRALARHPQQQSPQQATPHRTAHGTPSHRASQHANSHGTSPPRCSRSTHRARDP
mmetsp:Transcript_73711/g.221605  ORF Transcript_73711/g.221605 Transcript_73711/m.221605 type:complete len:202 (+) Transcript_73711:153-758(+)